MLGGMNSRERFHAAEQKLVQADELRASAVADMRAARLDLVCEQAARFPFDADELPASLEQIAEQIVAAWPVILVRNSGSRVSAGPGWSFRSEVHSAGYMFLTLEPDGLDDMPELGHMPRSFMPLAHLYVARAERPIWLQKPSCPVSELSRGLQMLIDQTLNGEAEPAVRELMNAALSF